MPSIRRVLRSVSRTQPINYVATSGLHAFFSAVGLQSEYIFRNVRRIGTVSSRLPNGRTLRLWSRGDDWIASQIYWRGWTGYEPETTCLFFRLATSAQTTLDIGAHVGFYSLLAAHANPSGQVFSFEPLPSLVNRLQRNIALNRLANVQCVPCAVGETEGTAELFYVANAVPSTSTLSTELKPDGLTRDLGEVRSMPVPVITVDGFVQNNDLKRIDLVKIDTESTEPQVLRGMADTLHRDHPTVLCEVLKESRSEDALEEILRPLGYHYYLLTSDGPVQQDRIEAHPEWRNYLFTTSDLDTV
jgi:FkbM family methyltransferase